MTTLTKNKLRSYEQGDLNEYPVVAADIIFEGAAVGDNGSGIARPLQAGDPFRGFAMSKADNALGAASAIRVQVRERGYMEVPIAALAITDVGKDVYMSDDDTFTLTQGANTRVGHVSRWVSTGIGIIYFEPNCGIEAELTDSSGGTASGTIAVIGATYDQAEVRNAVASLAAKVNYLLRKMGQ